MCGECIVRGDEVVSLGWCFWHRGCFGCLICSAKLDAPVPREQIKQERRWKSLDGSEGDGHGEMGIARRKGKCLGVQLEEIPLCMKCEDETSGACESVVLRRGLDNVTKYDGGLGRSRIERLSESIPKRLPRRAKIKGATGIESELERLINRSSVDFNGLRGPNVIYHRSACSLELDSI